MPRSPFPSTTTRPIIVVLAVLALVAACGKGGTSVDAQDPKTVNSANVNTDDPRLDDAEGDGADDEPSLSAFDGVPVYLCNVDLEHDEAEYGRVA